MGGPTKTKHKMATKVDGLRRTLQTLVESEQAISDRLVRLYARR